jgi:NDP-hexose-3-ketoreductase
MDILVVGASSIFCRRVLPALLSLDGIGRIHVASSRPAVEIEMPAARRGRFFHGYETALRELPPCLAYISLPNSLHGEWVGRALSAGFHVVVDKPAFLDLAEAESMLALAREKQRCLAEAAVWSFHPQVKQAREAFLRNGSEPHVIQSIFSFPPLPNSNFRNNPKLGGGSFHDLGAYAVSPGRVFFGDEPIDVWCRISERDETLGIDTGFAFTAMYSRGRVSQGFFSFGTEYKNSLTVLGRNTSVMLEPVFTLPPGMASNLTIRALNKTEIVAVPPGDSFAIFFGELIASIETGQWSRWPEILRQDINVLHRAATIAGIKKS